MVKAIINSMKSLKVKNATQTMNIQFCLNLMTIAYCGPILKSAFDKKSLLGFQSLYNSYTWSRGELEHVWKGDVLQDRTAKARLYSLPEFFSLHKYKNRNKETYTDTNTDRQTDTDTETNAEIDTETNTEANTDTNTDTNTQDVLLDRTATARLCRLQELFSLHIYKHKDKHKDRNKYRKKCRN